MDLLERSVIFVLACVAAFLLTGIFPILCFSVIQVERRKGIRLHIASYKEIEDGYSRMQAKGKDTHTGAQQTALYRNSRTMLEKWDRMNGLRKMEALYGHWLMLAGVLLLVTLLILIIRDNVSHGNPYVYLTLLIFIGMYLRGFIMMVKKMEDSTCLQQAEVNRMSRLFNVLGRYAVTIALAFIYFVLFQLPKFTIH